MQRVFTLAALLVMASSASAQPPGLPKVEKLPTQGLARIDDQGRLVIQRVDAMMLCEMQTATRTYTEYVEEQRTRSVADPANPTATRTESYTVKVPVTKAREYSFCVTKSVPKPSEVVCERSDGDGGWRCAWSESPVRFYTAGSDEIPLEAVRGHLDAWRQVLISDDGEMIESYYSRLFQPGTLVIALPERPMHRYGGYEMPMPAPTGPRPSEHPADSPPVQPAAPQPAAPPAAALPRGNGNGNAILVSVSQQAASSPELPNAVPPTFAFAQAAGNDLSLRFMTQSTQDQTLMRKVKADKDVSKVAPVQAQHVTRTNHIWTIPIDAVQGIDQDGNPLNQRDVASRLGRETTILVTTSNREVDRFWLKNLRPDTLILQTPLPDDAGVLSAQMPPAVYPATPYQSPPAPAGSAPVPHAPPAPAAGAPVPQAPPPPAA
jgi:hypothetical protein